MELKELLEKIEKRLAEMGDESALSDEQKAEKASLEASQKALAGFVPSTESGKGAESELERLRSFEREVREKEMVGAISKHVIGELADRQKSDAERIAGLVKDSVGEIVGGDGTLDIDAAVKKALAESREGSSFVGEGGEKDAVEDAVKNGQTAGKSGLSSVKVGEDREVKAINDRQNLAEFLDIASKIKSGLATDAQRKFMLETNEKAMAEMTDSAGGFLVPQEWMPDILGLLRANAIVRGAGPRFQPFNKKMNQTSISSGAAAYYILENTRIPTSEPVLAEAPLLTPKDLTGLVAVSNGLLNDSPESDNLVRSDLAEVMGLREDLSFLQGTGAGGGAEPIGMRNFVGRTQNPLGTLGGGNGDEITLAQMRRLRASVRTLNAQNPTWVWFFAPELITYLETLTDPDGRFLADSTILQINPDGMSGRFDGVPFFTSTQVPANLTYGTSTNASYVILANIREVVVGINQELVIDVSNEATYTTDGGTTWRSAFQERQTLFRAVMRHDIAPRRPNQVIVQEGVLV